MVTLGRRCQAKPESRLDQSNEHKQEQGRNNHTQDDGAFDEARIGAQVLWVIHRFVAVGCVNHGTPRVCRWHAQISIVRLAGRTVRFKSHCLWPPRAACGKS